MSVFLGFVTLLIVLAFDLVLIFANAWALTLLWEWFIVPSFAVAPLTNLSAIGIALVVSFLTGYTAPEKGLEFIDAIVQSFMSLIGRFIRIPIYIGMAWIILKLI